MKAYTGFLVPRRAIGILAGSRSRAEGRRPSRAPLLLWGTVFAGSLALVFFVLIGPDAFSQLDFTLRPKAHTLPLIASEVARHLRASFYGTEALRQQSGRNEIKVMVRLPESERIREHDIEELMIPHSLVPCLYVMIEDAIGFFRLVRGALTGEPREPRREGAAR